MCEKLYNDVDKSFERGIIIDESKGENNMRSLYSVILSDDVVREIDRRAVKMNTNRSKLIDRILAEYVSYTTPEMRISNIFQSMEELINSWDDALVPFVIPNQSTMSLKTNLEYKYRPTIKYDVELFPTEKDGALGQISIMFRTQSVELLNMIGEFFQFWMQLEASYGHKSKYVLTDGKFVRSISIDRNASTKQIADAISDFIKVFDRSLKGYLAGKYSKADIHEMYKQLLNKGDAVI